MDDDQDVKRRILEKARELFFRWGFSKISADRIAEELGMSKKTLYRHFPSKKEMLREAVFMTLGDVETKFAAIAADGRLSRIEKLRESFRTAAVTVSQIQGDLIRDMARTVPDVWRQIEQQRERIIFSHLKRLLAEGTENGIIREDLDQDLILHVHFELLRSILTPENLAGMPYSMVDVLEAVVNILYGGILTDEGRAEMRRIDLKRTEVSE